ncbi:MAG: hypothetical protein FWF95_02380 [Syntrophorhabdaceae bacterium]|nr:hypothetical protein [Syntrophorhabdaceae bacterium]
MSDTFLPRKHRKGKYKALLFLTVAALLAGCFGSTPYVPTKDEDDLLKAKGADKALYETICIGESDPFVLIAVFREDVFRSHSAVLEQSFIPVLNEFGNTALLLVRPVEVLPLLKDASLIKAAWFGPQARLARLDTSLEFDMLSHFGKGTESSPAVILVQFRSLPKVAEEKAVIAAGFQIHAKEGPTYKITGPISGIPKLLDHDWVVYLEKIDLPQ